MEFNKIKDELVLRNVEVEDIEQFNNLLKYVFQVSNQSLVQLGYSEKELVKVKYPVLQNSNVLGWFDNEGYLVSQICVLPLKVNIHNTIFEMGGVTGVGTYPEYANLGLMNDLIKKALYEMKSNNQYISYLFPYSIPYYRKKGWEIISDRIKYSINDNQLPAYDNVAGTVSRESVEHEDVKEVYNNYALNNHGALIRNDSEWEEYWRWEDEEERIAAIYYDENDKAQGYILYWIDEDIMYVKDFIYLTTEARVGLCNFIGAHYSMIEKLVGTTYRNETIAFHMKDSAIEEIIEPYYMARIVDVENFLKLYPFKKIDKPFHFIVSDSIVEENNATFSISKDNQDKIVISTQALGQAIKLDINTLTSMLLSYRNVDYYYKYNYLDCNEDALKILKDSLYETTPYFSDYF